MKVQDNYIQCNEVTTPYGGPANIGIEYDIHNSNVGDPYVNTSILITQNCIYNASVAMIFDNTNFHALIWDIPVVQNNFLYDYSQDGMVILSFTGNIGSGCGVPQAGGNTFMTSIATAIDVFCTPLGLGLQGNWKGPYCLNCPLIIVGSAGNNPCPDPTPSWTSCQFGGNRIDSSQQSVATDPEHYILQHFPITQNGTDFVLNSNFMEAVNAAVDKYDFVVTLMSLLGNNSNNDELNKLCQAVKNNGLFDSHKQLWVDYQYMLITKNLKSAYSLIKTITPQSTDEGEMISIEEIRLPYSWNGLSVTSMPDVDRKTLRDIYNNKSVYRIYARQLLQMAGGEPVYTDDYEIMSNIPSQPVLPWANLKNDIMVYPNPTSGELTIYYSVKNNDGALRLTDLTGRIIKEYPIGNNGTLTIDISEMAQGAYFLWLYSNDLFVKSIKVIKD